MKPTPADTTGRGTWSPPPRAIHRCACPQDHRHPCRGGAALSWRTVALLNLLAVLLLTCFRVYETANARIGTLSGQPAASPLPANCPCASFLVSNSAILFVGATGFEPATPCPPVSRDTELTAAREVP